MIVVDSSAVVAMMLGEPESGALAVRLAQAPRGERLMSVANYVEAGTVLEGRRETPARAIEDLDAFSRWRASTSRPSTPNRQGLRCPRASSSVGDLARRRA